MKIFAYKPGHDGHVAAIDDGRLIFSMEAEKDSGNRYGPVTPELMLHGFAALEWMPDVFGVSGWERSFRPMRDPIGAGYLGTTPDTNISHKMKMFGQELHYFSDTHERSHIIGSYGMSPFSQGEPAYALVWEGVLGHFYRVDENLNIAEIGSPLSGPGHKYGFLYGLADPAYPFDASKSRREDAGKLMALSGFGRDTVETQEERELIERILEWDAVASPLRKSDFKDSPFCNIGLDSPDFHNLARRFQHRIFERFFEFAENNMKEGLPILVSGGCGLNCDWNSAWRESGLFKDVFVQPCTNDSGSAIGTAIDAQLVHTGNAKIDWTVYAGEEFVMDDADVSGFDRAPLDLDEFTGRLVEGGVYAWVNGRYEIGPRALGNRSLVAAPFTAETHTRLNAIKKREGFRPIAPILMEEELDRHFNNHGPSPHMLYFQTARTDALKAVTHVDGSARAQTVRQSENPQMYALLSAFKNKTGYGVLCNTSLNFNGKGFINRLSDLVRYATDTGLDGFVVNGSIYRRRA
ncbi:carbamoyltransferase C-terminal domain-containing protein [Hoeflea sp. TYP-13]|uniref:carbamoyltransferase C-terminal domain-containing protein n=1 Tax=Hoeflea sp. TYP-13 TaxID=3230023 RepID=UPI0034C678A0